MIARGTSAGPAPPAGALVVWLLVLLAVPATFTAARVRRDLERLQGFVEQSRVGEAAALAHRVLALDAGAEFHDRPLSEVAAHLDAAARKLTRRAEAPLPAGATSAQRLSRAEDLAMLGRVHEALAVSAAIDDAALTPDVANLRGTIFEAQEQWDDGLAAYQQAKLTLQRRPPSPDRNAALARALTGVAYCQRKLGDYAQSEAAHQELLTLAPTAASHFLLAEFYEGTQQTAAAELHARRAMELDPDRYGRPAQQLIGKLSVFHFGCWSVSGSR